MKKSRFASVTIAIILALSLSLTAFAAIYIAKQAKMTVFSGRIEQTTSTPTDPKLVLKTIAGTNLGQTGNISTYGETTFPILSNVTGCTIMNNEESTFETNWNDQDGKIPPTAQRFVLTAENGNLSDLSYEIIINGNTATSALRFGVTYRYFNEELNTTVTCTRVDELLPSTTNTASSGKIELGDGNILENEEIIFEITAWVDADALTELGEYENDIFNVEVVFSTPEE